MPQDLALSLERAVAAVAPRLRSVADAAASSRPSPGKWSRKEELGHLIDSATNNHVRFVRASLEPELRIPTYDGDGWVRLHAYEEMPWTTLIEFWARYNDFLAELVRRIPDSALDRPCVIGNHDPMTLRALIEDYVRHMQQHLDHILR